MFDRLCLLRYGAIFTWALSPVANTSWFSFTEHAVQCREALTPQEILLPKLLAALWTREKFLTRVSSEQKGLHISKWTVGSNSSLKLCQQLLLKWWIDLWFMRHPMGAKRTANSTRDQFKAPVLLKPAHPANRQWNVSHGPTAIATFH